MRKLVVRLQVHPELLRRTEVLGQPDRSIRGDATLAVHHLVDATRRHSDRDRQLVLRIPKPLMKSSNQNLAWMDRLDQVTVVIVDECDIYCPLCPYNQFANERSHGAVLTIAIPSQPFQPVDRRDPEILHILGRVDGRDGPSFIVRWRGRHRRYADLRLGLLESPAG